MRTNASLENARNLLCDSLRDLRLVTGDNTPEKVICQTAYMNIIYALQELDSFRHGKLQKCLICGEEIKNKNECESII